ncbi:MAG: septum formation protein Maf [Candidatus Eisenbacteria sp.]|nr:septum formation protein Maf [Candidatus Eisenbacteria bacterium]
MGSAEPLVLASRSPRRAQLLRMLGVQFETRPPAGDGPPREAGESPQDYVRRQAEAKALSIARQAEVGIVLGADTIVFLDGEVLEKPRDAAQARTFLRRLADREHEVYTGVALMRAGGAPRASGVERSRVRFGPLDDAVIAAYVASGEPLDKAGAYGIQGLGGQLVTAIEGCYFNVMGLPLARLRALFRELGRASTDREGDRA